MLLNIWGADHGPWMQALHAIFGAGAWLGPLIARPFLAEEMSSDEMGVPITTTADVIIQTGSGLKQLVNTTMQLVMKNDGSSTEATIKELQQTTDVMYAYLIVGLLCLSAGAIFSGLFLIGKRALCVLWSEEETLDASDSQQFKTLDQSYVIKLASLVFAFYVSYCVLEMNYGNFLLTYAVKHLGWSKSMAASVTSAYWGSFMAGRICGIVVIRYIRPQVMLIIDVIMCMASLVPILLFAEDHIAVLWVCTLVFGFFMSTIFATGRPTRSKEIIYFFVKYCSCRTVANYHLVQCI